MSNNSLRCFRCKGQHHPAECPWEDGRRYKSVDDMIWKLSSWKFKLKWFWMKLWRKKNGK